MRFAVTVVATLALASVAAAQVPAEPDVNAAEFKCMYNTAKADAKFAVAKTKCIAKCFANAWKGLISFSECYAPYGGATAVCINDATFLRGAENRFEAYIKKYCVSASGADCPECFNGGDCTLYAGDRVQSRELQLDAFVPGVICENTGAEPAEQRCQIQNLRALGKFYSSSLTCYAKCFADARSNGRPLEECLPPVTNSRWYGCLTSTRAKAEGTIHKYCHETSTPLAPPECGPDPYPDEVQWTTLMNIAIEGVLPDSFCAQ